MAQTVETRMGEIEVKLIDADKARGMILRYFPECAPCTAVFGECIVKDAKLEVRAHWERTEDTDEWTCSNCNDYITGYEENPVKYGVKYCPHCGAIMDGE